jgi:hypothetical protein
MKGDVTVTTRDAAAAQRRCLAVVLASLIGVAGLSLAGCTGGSSWGLFDSANKSSEPEAQPRAVAEAPVAKVSINAIVGPPPETLGKQLYQEFTSVLTQQRIAVAQKNESADFHLRPYVLATKEKGGTKVSYVLDVSDPNGNKVNRFTGEELVAASPSADPWQAITPPVAQAIAAKTMGAFVAWLPNAAAGKVAAVAPTPASVAPKSEPVARAPAKRKTAVSSSAQTTGSITKDGNVSAMVPAVTGAPGDGSTSLTAAIQRELQTRGVAVADRATPASFRVEGSVTLGASREGKQPIQIEWVVKDPQGKKLGTVSQKNDIPEGSLDGPWGRVADQAASAAVQGILKLLPTAAEAVN